MPMENFVNEFNMWMQTVQSELQEKSMRSTIIICAATLDAQLEKLIKNILLQDRKSTRLNSSHRSQSRMPSSA